MTLSLSLCIALAGGLGTLARYSVGCAFPQTGFPFTVFAVNMLGCFLYGMAAPFFAKEILPSAWQTVFLTGFLGGFTTFSAFANQNWEFFNNGESILLSINLFGQNILGIACVMLGITLARNMLA